MYQRMRSKGTYQAGPRHYAIFLWCFGRGGLCSYKLCWVDLMGLDEDSSSSVKLFKCFVKVIVHLHNLFNDYLEFRTVVQYRGRIFARLYIIWVIVIRVRTDHQRDIIVAIGGKFLVRALIFCCSGAVWNPITDPDGYWCGAFGGGSLGGSLIRGVGDGAGRWVCPARTVGWGTGGE